MLRRFIDLLHRQRNYLTSYSNHTLVHRIEHIVIGSVGQAIVVELLSRSWVLHGLGLVDILYAPVVLLVALVALALAVLQVLVVLGNQLLRVNWMW